MSANPVLTLNHTADPSWPVSKV